MPTRKRTELRRELAERERGPGKRDPETLRQEAVRYATQRRVEGASLRAVARELGLRPATLRCWCEREGEPSDSSAALLPVEVVPEPGPTRRGLALVSPSGFRLEGLELEEEAIAALGSLS